MPCRYLVYLSLRCVFTVFRCWNDVIVARPPHWLPTRNELSRVSVVGMMCMGSLCAGNVLDVLGKCACGCLGGWRSTVQHPATGRCVAVCFVQHPGTGGCVGLHGQVDGSGNVFLVTDAGQQHLGCGGQMRSVFLGRFPFDRSLPGHGRLRCGCRSTVQHPGACGCALLSQAESRNMFIPPGSEPRGCFGGCRSHRSTTRAW